MDGRVPSHLISLLDQTSEWVHELIYDAARLKIAFKNAGSSDQLKGKTAALFFEKPSLRTKVTFEVAMIQMGGAAIVLDPGSISLGKRESVHDATKSLSRWVDCIVARTFSHRLVEELASFSGIPVINALTDFEHPCQALAFGEMVYEKFGKLRGLNVVFVGDGNNVANSLAALAAHCGMHFTLACPEGYEQPTAFLEQIAKLNLTTGGSCRCVRDPGEAVQNADIIYSDVWVSMGEEARSELKKRQFQHYQINDALLALAPSHCLVTHCLPAHLGEEITQEVMDSPRCVCFDEAENRLHAQKAVLLRLLH